jgi:phosphonate transport system permease protein
VTILIHVPSVRKLSAPWDKTRIIKWLLVIGFAVGGASLIRYLQFAPGELLSGLFKKGGYLSRAFPPTFTSTNSAGGDERSEWGITLTQLVRTLIMAFAGTGFAAVLSFPVGLLAARNISPHRVLSTITRAFISFCRATPEIVFATVFVLIASIGERAGVMALAVHSIGMLAKLLSDRIEEIDDKPLEAARAAGGTRIQVIYNAVLPQIVPSWINNIVYRFDINLRASAVLGFVGAGGIGLLLQSDLKNATRYPIGMATALSLAIVIVIVEIFSNLLRRHLNGVETRLTREQRDTETAVQQALAGRRGVGQQGASSRSLTPPLNRERASFFTLIWGSVGIWLWCMWQVGLFTMKSVKPFGFRFPVPQCIAIPATAFGQIGKYWPNWKTVGYLFKGQVVTGHAAWTHAWRDTLLIAGGAAFMATIAAIPASFLVARSTSPAKSVSMVSRGFLVLARSLPEIALVFFFVSALGIQSPFPCAAAMAIGAFAFITKLTADDLHGIGQGPQEALRANGATRSQEVIGAVVPSAVPMLVANAMYCLDVCVRGGVLLGTIAGVGVGYLFTQTGFLPNPFQTVGAFVLSTFVIVFGIERLGAFVRRRLL